MFWRILRRILRRHVTHHLLIPLIVGLVVDIVIAYSFTHHVQRWHELKHYLLSVERAGLIGGIFVAYFLVMYFVVKEETSISIDPGGRGVLRENLEDAVSFFALNTISIREWFGPAAQEYLSEIEKRRTNADVFRHERVLLFFSRKDYVDLVTPYIDKHYTDSLVQMHKNYGITLAFLERKDIFGILASLSVGERKTVCCYQRWLTWCPTVILKFPFWRLRRRMPELGCVLIEASGGRKSVLRISKHGENMRIRQIPEKDVEAYVKLVGLIKAKIHRPGDGRLYSAYNFTDQVDSIS